MATSTRTTLRVWRGSTFRDFPNSYGHPQVYGEKVLLFIQTGSQSHRAVFNDWLFIEYVEPKQS